MLQKEKKCESLFYQKHLVFCSYCTLRRRENNWLRENDQIWTDCILENKKPPEKPKLSGRFFFCYELLLV
jgi:hypothetical protein